MQPKNTQRREAITSKTYCELLSGAQAEEYFSDLLSQNLKIELAGRESAIRSSYITAASGLSANLFLEAPDIHFAAAVLFQEGFLIGNGGRTEIIYQILKAGPKCKAIPDKLKLIQLRKFHGHKLFSDKWGNHKENKEAIKKKTIFQLWFTLVRQKNAITSEEFERAFPDIADRIRFWDQCIDDEMKPTLNTSYYTEYTYKRLKEKRMAMQIAMAKKKTAQKF